MLLQRGGHVYHCFKGVDTYLIVSKGWCSISHCIILLGNAYNLLHQNGSHVMKGNDMQKCDHSYCNLYVYTMVYALSV